MYVKFSASLIAASVLTVLRFHNVASIKCYNCFGWPADSNLTEEEFQAVANSSQLGVFNPSCIDEPDGLPTKQCRLGCLTMVSVGKKAHDIQDRYQNISGDTLSTGKRGYWPQAVYRACVEDTSLTGLNVAEPEVLTCQYWNGLAFGIWNSHSLICGCNSDLCNRERDLVEKFYHSYCTVKHILTASPRGESNASVFSEASTYDRKSCILSCIRNPECRSIRLTRALDVNATNGWTCGLSTSEWPCSEEHPTELAEDLEQTPEQWLGCFSQSCINLEARHSIQKVQPEEGCRFITYDPYPDYCRALKEAMPDRRFCTYKGFKDTCPNTCCDIY